MQKNDDSWKEKLRDAGFTVFEGQKTRLVQGAEGHTITILIDDRDVLNALPAITSFLKTRMGVALIEINSSEELIPVTVKGNAPHLNAEAEEGRRAFVSACALCREVPFQKWVAQKAGDDFVATGEVSEGAATAWLKEELGIQSRRELANRPQLRQHFSDIRGAFIADRRAGRI